MWPELSVEEMESVFSKVDATADGLVAWDEFLSFMVLHNQSVGNLREESRRTPQNLVRLRLRVRVRVTG